jgi:hypothetical protein
VPKAAHLTSYSYRVRRQSNEQLMAGLIRRVRTLGLASGAQGFNLDFHAIRHHGTDTPLEKHYVPRRSQRTRAVLTFFAQDHASTEMVYANADLTKAEQAREIVAFADYWQQIAGTDPGLLVFDSKLTTYKVLSELTAHGIRWLTLRERGPKLMADLAVLPATEWNAIRVERSGRYRAPEIQDQIVKIKDIEGPVRQLAVRNIGRDQPTLLITNDLERTTKQLFARYAERMGIENELDAYISGFHLDALSSGLPLNVDLDTTLTVIAGNLYRLLARRLTRYEHATPRPPMAPLPRQHRHPPPHRRHTHPRAAPPHLPPRTHRRRARRPSHPNPLARQPPTAVPLPALLKEGVPFSVCRRLMLSVTVTPRASKCDSQFAVSGSRSPKWILNARSAVVQFRVRVHCGTALRSAR